MLVIGLFALAAWVRETRDWPTARSDNVLLVGVLVIGLIPLGLALEAGVQWQQEIDKLRTSFPAAAPATPPGLTTYPWNALWIAWREGKPNPFAPEQFPAAALGREIEET